MCKSDTIVMIDSNDRTPDSNSTSDFTVNLSSSLLIDDDHGIQLKSLYIPNTLKTFNIGVNNKLYTSLDDGTTTTYHTLTFQTIKYNTTMTALVTVGNLPTSKHFWTQPTRQQVRYQMQPAGGY